MVSVGWERMMVVGVGDELMMERWVDTSLSGFGPCTDLIHGHRSEVRVPNDSQIVRKTQNGDRDNQIEESEGISKTPLKVVVPVTRNEDVLVDSESEEEQSDETLYLINEEDRAWALFLEHEGKIGNTTNGTAVHAEAASDSKDESELCEEPRALINEDEDRRVGDRLTLRCTQEGQKDSLEYVVESGKREVDEEGFVAEAAESKRIWSMGDISFDSSDEEEVLVRFTTRN
ncbi:hypothetical protein PIB30_059372 [Stylosanthes scabra]|uniref:Uncharacterized protein n=1 Tax=Stylosanthes scabra TaxID=79078 RepID=A0ABU6ZIX4_9FABA|nr:hypothetical protein [Stylosanthes scabra]